MRFGIGGMIVTSVVMFGLPAASDDDFMKECIVTIERRTCECISAKIPANERAAARAGLRKSNEAMAPGGNLLDPATLPPFEMKGLNAVVLAQASCM